MAFRSCIQSLRPRPRAGIIAAVRVQGHVRHDDDGAMILQCVDPVQETAAGRLCGYAVWIHAVFSFISQGLFVTVVDHLGKCNAVDIIPAGRDGAGEKGRVIGICRMDIVRPIGVQGLHALTEDMLHLRVYSRHGKIGRADGVAARVDGSIAAIAHVVAAQQDDLRHDTVVCHQRQHFRQVVVPD